MVVTHTHATDQGQVTWFNSSQWKRTDGQTEASTLRPVLTRLVNIGGFSSWYIQRKLSTSRIYLETRVDHSPRVHVHPRLRIYYIKRNGLLSGH